MTLGPARELRDIRLPPAFWDAVSTGSEAGRSGHSGADQLPPPGTRALGSLVPTVVLSPLTGDPRGLQCKRVNEASAHWLGLALIICIV